MNQRFQDRAEAGRLLASKLRVFKDQPDLVVLALPRGGVPVGAEVARALRAPLDVFVVRNWSARPAGACHGRDRHGRSARPQP